MDQLKNENNVNLPSSAPATWGEGVDTDVNSPPRSGDDDEENQRLEEAPSGDIRQPEAELSFQPQSSGSVTTGSHLGHQEPDTESLQPRPPQPPVVVNTPRDELVSRIEDTVGLGPGRAASNQSGRSGASETNNTDQRSSDWGKTLRPWISPRSEKRKINYRELDGGDRRKRAKNYHISFGKYIQHRTFGKGKPAFRVSNGRDKYDILTEKSNGKLTIKVPLTRVEIHMISIPRWL